MLNDPVTIPVEAVALLNIICLSEKGKGLGFFCHTKKMKTWIFALFVQDLVFIF